jgi:hypothetical protein
LVQEPFSGMTPELFAALSDQQIASVYLAPRDKKGRLIPEWKLLRRRERAAPGGAPEPTGDPRRAGRELPAPESLDIPPEALLMGVPMAYVSMFWSVWVRRGALPADIMRRFREQVKACRPRGHRGE